MRRIVLWGLSTLSVVVLLFGYSTSTSGPDTAAGPAFVSETTAGASTASSSSGSATAGGSGSGSQTVTGAVARTRWGPVQVQLTVAGSTITRVAVLQYPDDNSKDEEISNYALPILIKETMDAQSADVDMVSGATYTSDGYIQSLQSALDQANA